ncbi:MAG TPA: magnesium/cobalt transporter CorA [Bacteroidia bacterium]|nr:magnesium/cobalt transporter CorA [Bacteroidia bacterium]
MARQKYHKIIRKKRKGRPRPEPGAEPGAIITDGEICPVIKVFSYRGEEFEEKDFTSTAGLFDYLNAHQHLYHWVDTIGYGNREYFDNMSLYFGLHLLQVEDIVSLHQRPKVEEFANHLFIISRMKYTNKNGEFIDEQLSMFVYENMVLSFQDYEDDCLAPVRDRIRRNNSHLRERDSFYLAYIIQDAIIDNYFPVLDELSDRLEKLEEIALDRPDRDMLNELQDIKRTLIDLRKTIWPEKDKINELLRSKYKLVKPDHEIYLRDTYDHCIQIMDLIESNKEITHSIMDVYLSSVNNKLGEVMKVLTVISSIFIPLTFIVGVYGMNFSPVDKNGQPLPLNMPELYNHYGYLGVMAFMLLIAIGQIIYFKRRKWL